MARENKSGGLGLLLTSDVIYAAQVRVQNGLLEVVSHGSIETPPGSIRESSIINSARVGQAIRELCQRLRYRGRTASVVLPSAGYQMRALRLPEVPQADQRAIVRGEMEGMTLLTMGGGAFDFLWLPNVTGDDKRQADAFVYYADDFIVDELRDTLRQAGLRLEAIEPVTITIMRAYLAGL